MSDFNPSPSQIVKNVYNKEKEAITTDLAKDFAALQLSLLRDIVTELKITNFHLAEITGDEIEKDDLD